MVARTRRHSLGLGVACLALLALSAVGPARAEVRRVVVTSRQGVLDGAYERLTGSVELELDPAHPANAGIVDLDHAPATPAGASKPPRISWCCAHGSGRPGDRQRSSRSATGAARPCCRTSTAPPGVSTRRPTKTSAIAC